MRLPSIEGSSNNKEGPGQFACLLTKPSVSSNKYLIALPSETHNSTMSSQSSIYKTVLNNFWSEYVPDMYHVLLQDAQHKFDWALFFWKFHFHPEESCICHREQLGHQLFLNLLGWSRPGTKITYLNHKIYFFYMWLKIILYIIQTHQINCVVCIKTCMFR